MKNTKRFGSCCQLSDKKGFGLNEKEFVTGYVRNMSAFSEMLNSEAVEEQSV